MTRTQLRRNKEQKKHIILAVAAIMIIGMGNFLMDKYFDHLESQWAAEHVANAPAYYIYSE